MRKKQEIRECPHWQPSTTIVALLNTQSTLGTGPLSALKKRAEELLVKSSLSSFLWNYTETDLFPKSRRQTSQCISCQNQSVCHKKPLWGLSVSHRPFLGLPLSQGQGEFRNGPLRHGKLRSVLLWLPQILHFFTVRTGNSAPSSPEITTCPLTITLCQLYTFHNDISYRKCCGPQSKPSFRENEPLLRCT